MKRNYIMKPPFWTIALLVGKQLYPIIPWIDYYDKSFHGYTTVNSLSTEFLLRFKHYQTAIKRAKQIKQFYKTHKNNVLNKYEIVLIQIDKSINDTIIELKSKGIYIY